MSGLPGMRVDLDALEALSPADQELARRQLEALERAHRDNPLLGYHPHPKQVVFHSPPFPAIRAFFGGNRSGKTTAAVLDTIIQVIGRDLVPEHLLPYKRWDPPVKVRIVTPDLTNTLD